MTLTSMNSGPIHRNHKIASGTAARAGDGAEVLYLSYDGMCDPLGRSQVLPYLTGLAKMGHRITLISFEKPERGDEERGAVRRICMEVGLTWHPLTYHKRPPLLSSIYDVRRMRNAAVRLHEGQRFDLVHCRSYLPALIGLRMKRRYGVPFIFDMRGFWADERVEGGIWKLSNPLYRVVYRYFKNREAEFLEEADHIVSLTDEAKRVLVAGNALIAPITVIPCCVDFEAFPRAEASDRSSARQLLGIDLEERVLVYVGSVGGNYMLEQMLDFFIIYRARHGGGKFLFISMVPQSEFFLAAHMKGIRAEDIRVRAARRNEVPFFVAAADEGIAFKQSSYSAKACSPTKLGELLAVEIPVFVNSGVGDVDQIIRDTGAGVIIESLDVSSYDQAVIKMTNLNPDKELWRARARRWFDLGSGVQRLHSMYLRTLRAQRGV